MTNELSELISLNSTLSSAPPLDLDEDKKESTEAIKQQLNIKDRIQNMKGQAFVSSGVKSSSSVLDRAQSLVKQSKEN